MGSPNDPFCAKLVRVFSDVLVAFLYFDGKYQNMEKPLLFKNIREGSDYSLKDYTRLYSPTFNKICLMS